MDWLRTSKGRFVVLLIASLILMIVLLPISLSAHGSNGAIAVVFALSICLSANLPSLIFANRLRTSQAAIFQVALSCGIRMGLPMAACLVVAFQRNWLFHVDFVYYLMAFYFLMLILETISQVACLRATSSEPMEAQ